MQEKTPEGQKRAGYVGYQVVFSDSKYKQCIQLLDWNWNEHQHKRNISLATAHEFTTNTEENFKCLYKPDTAPYTVKQYSHLQNIRHSRKIALERG